MNPAANHAKSNPETGSATPAKKRYETPAVKVYGDVRELTGSGPSRGVSDLALSSLPHFS